MGEHNNILMSQGELEARINLAASAAVKAERERWLAVFEAMNEHAYASDPELTRLICIKSILAMALPAARGEEYAQKTLDAQIADAAAIRARGESDEK